MKTISEYLRPSIMGNKFSQSRADEMCLALNDYVKVHYNLESDELRALYRFAMLTFDYMDKECNDEDFTILSFFKLLYCEVAHENFREEDDEYQTIYEVLIEDALKKGRDTIYMMSKFYEEVRDHMPEKSDEIYHYAIKFFCGKHGIEFYDDDMAKAKEYFNSVEKSNNHPSNTDAEDAFDINNLLDFFSSFADFRETGELSDFDEAEEAIEEFDADTGRAMKIYQYCSELLRDYRNYSDVKQAIDKNFILKRI